MRISRPKSSSYASKRDIIASTINGQLLLLEQQDSTIAKRLSSTRKLSDVSNTCRCDDDVKALVRNVRSNNMKFQDLACGITVSVHTINNI